MIHGIIFCFGVTQKGTTVSKASFHREITNCKTNEHESKFSFWDNKLLIYGQIRDKIVKTVWVKEYFEMFTIFRVVSTKFRGNVSKLLLKTISANFYILWLRIFIQLRRSVALRKWKIHYVNSLLALYNCNLYVSFSFRAALPSIKQRKTGNKRF